jgi:hypothetical protein
MSALERLTAALEGHGCAPRGGKAKCPAHDDREPSLAVSQGERGAVLHCHAGCSASAVLGALGLQAADLFDTPRANGSAGQSRTIVAKHEYTDEAGALLYHVVRFAPKDFRQRAADGTWSTKGIRRVLYRLPEVLAAVAAGDRVYVVEGEKDADAAAGAQLVATCNPGGAGKWRGEYAEVLRGADVTVIADRDEPGRRHAREVAASLSGVARSVEIREVARGKDLADHLAAGLGPEDLVPLTDDKADAAQLTAQKLEALAFTGPRLLELLTRPAPPPLEPGLPAEGHVTLMVAPPMTGKTTWALWLAMARAAGCAPWKGTNALEPGRVLLLSLDEAPEQVARRMNGLAIFHPAGRLERYAHRIAVVGPDRDVAPETLDALRFDSAGLKLLAEWIETTVAAGEPFRDCYVDAYADMLPLGETENSNELATIIGGTLERIAVTTGAAVTLLHHTGKPPKPTGGKAQATAPAAPPDLRFLARGASALAAKARLVLALDVPAGLPHVRRIRAATNLSRAPRPLLLQVCADAEDSEEILYFKHHDPLGDREIEDLLQPGEILSTTDLAWRLSGEEPQEGATPPGELKRQAAALREQWRRAGLVTVTAGPRGAKMIALAEPS